MQMSRLSLLEMDLVNINFDKSQKKRLCEEFHIVFFCDGEKCIDFLCGKRGYDIILLIIYC